jgi:hypothetical protein
MYSNNGSNNNNHDNSLNNTQNILTSNFHPSVNANNSFNVRTNAPNFVDSIFKISTPSAEAVNTINKI